MSRSENEAHTFTHRKLVPFFLQMAPCTIMIISTRLQGCECRFSLFTNVSIICSPDGSSTFKQLSLHKLFLIIFIGYKRLLSLNEISCCPGHIFTLHLIEIS